MRKEEVPALQWEQVDLEASTIALAPEDTKTDEPRLIVLTQRAKEALRTLPSRFKKKGFVFVNPKTKTRLVDIKKSFRRAIAAAELPGLRATYGPVTQLAPAAVVCPRPVRPSGPCLRR